MEQHQQQCAGRFAAMPAKAAALFTAVQSGDNQRMQQLLQDEDVWYAFMVGADQCAVSDTGKSCMQLAAADGSIDVAQQLLAAGACSTHRDDCGRTALHEAATTGNISILQMLVAVATKPDQHGYSNTTAAMQYLSSALPLAAAGGHTEALQVLLKGGADPSYDNGDSEGLTALHHAARLDLPEVCKLLLDACAARLPAVLPALNKRISDHFPLHAGRTPLQIAAYYGSLNATGVLLAAGADTGNVDNRGESIIYTAVSRGHIQLAQKLVDAWAVVDAATSGILGTPLLIAVNQGNAEGVKMLLQAGADVNAPLSLPAGPGSPSATLLHVAAKLGHADILQLLLDSSKALINSPFWEPEPQHVQPQVLVQTQQCLWGTPLQVAVHWGKHAAADVLLQAGAQVDAASPSNPVTSLDDAVHMGDVQMVQLLVAAGADVNARSEVNHGRSHMGALNLLAVAASSYHSGAVPVVQALLSAGVRSSSVDTFRHDALELAVKRRHLGMIRTLLASDSFPLDADPVAVLSKATAYSLRDNLSFFAGPYSYDVSALLQLQLRKVLQEQGKPGPVLEELFEGEGLPGFERNAVSVALLKGWASDTAEADTAHAVVASKEAQHAIVRAGAPQLLLPLISSRKASMPMQQVNTV